MINKQTVRFVEKPQVKEFEIEPGNTLHSLPQKIKRGVALNNVEQSTELKSQEKKQLEAKTPEQIPIAYKINPTSSLLKSFAKGVANTLGLREQSKEWQEGQKIKPVGEDLKKIYEKKTKVVQKQLLQGEYKESFKKLLDNKYNLQDLDNVNKVMNSNKYTPKPIQKDQGVENIRKLDKKNLVQTGGKGGGHGLY